MNGSISRRQGGGGGPELCRIAVRDATPGENALCLGERRRLDEGLMLADAAQMFGEPRRLQTDVGHGGDFPERRLAHRPDGEQAPRSASVWGDQRAIDIDVEADMKRVGARQTVRK